MDNTSNQLDLAYDISQMELSSLEEEDLVKAREFAEQRAQIVESVFASDCQTDRDQFMEKLLKLQKMQTRITESARKLHNVLTSELKRVKTENARFTGYKKATTVTPLFNPYLNKKG